MPRISKEKKAEVYEYIESLPPEIFGKCTICTETLTHVSKQAEAKIGVGTATITNAIAEIHNQNAALADRVTGEALNQRIRWNEGLKCQSDKINKNLFVIKPVKSVATATKWTGDQESYTPEEYIEAARTVMGSIDVDPASNDLANETVKAEKYYTKEDNGLTKPWIGNVFLNPPYSHPEIKYFIEKLLEEISNGNTSQAVLLTNNNTDTGWFHKAAKVSQYICLTLGRINFYKTDGSITHPTNGQLFFYFGANQKQFCEQFSQYGLIVRKS